jgi:Domain of unknown function (DUF4249)
MPTNLSRKIPLACLGVFPFLVPGCLQTLSSYDISHVPVVQGYLYDGEPVASIRLYDMIPFNSSDTVASPIVIDGVSLIQDGEAYALQSDQDGFYHSDHVIRAGETYTLRFRYSGKTVTATTTVPKPVTGVRISLQKFTLDSLKRVVLDRGDTLVIKERDTLVFQSGDTVITNANRMRQQHAAYGIDIVLNSPDTLVAHPADTLRSDSVPRNNRNVYVDSVYQDIDGKSILYLVKRPDTASITNRSRSKSTTAGDTLYLDNGDTVRFVAGETLSLNRKFQVLDSNHPILVQSSTVARQTTFGALPVIKWVRGDSSYVYVKIENVDSNAVDIASGSAVTTPTTPAGPGAGGGPGGGGQTPGGGVPGVTGGPQVNSRFTGAPTQSDSLRITAQMITQYGKHQAIIYRVNPEYRALFTSTQAGPNGNANANANTSAPTGTSSDNQLQEPSTNVKNGLGVFTAFCGDTVTFTVLKPAP